MSARTPDYAELAIDAAQAAIWEWRSSDNTFSLQASEAGPVSDLAGEWALNAFLLELDGLSRSALPSVLTDASVGTLVDQQLLFANGRSVRLVGAYEAPGVARGLCLIALNKPTMALSERVVPVFQPIVELSSDRPAGFEALARWRDGNGEILSADRLPAGEKNFSSRRLAAVMLEKSVASFCRWTQLTKRDDLFIQVNLSGADLFRATVLEQVQALVKDNGLSPLSLRIELTEQTALRDFNRSLKAIRAFRDAGIGIVLDDFGSGHSSLAWLAQIEADALKIDGELIRYALEPRGYQIVDAMVRLARDLGMSVTAEGVETEALLSLVGSLGFDFAQGYAVGRPMEAAEVDRWLLD